MHHPVGKGEQKDKSQGTQGILLPGLADQPAESLPEFLLECSDTHEKPSGSGSGHGFAHGRPLPSALKGIARIGRDKCSGKQNQQRCHYKKSDHCRSLKVMMMSWG
jgi:hypothetical protein